jgi:hypothetical protein
MGDDQTEPKGEKAREPSWDRNVADAAFGKVVLAGVTYLAAHGLTVKRQIQWFGIVVGVDEKAGVTIERQGKFAGERATLPPDLSIFTPAAPGEYRLRSTDEVVVDPDFLSQWTVTEPVKH